MDYASLSLAFTALLLGGILKGAVGAGSPVVAVPILSLLYGVPFAVSMFVIPNLVTNLWQGWQYRRALQSPRFAVTFAVAGGLGAAVGSVMLVTLHADYLMLMVAFAVIGYITFRLLRPDWKLPMPLAQKLALPVGAAAGVLQGAGGISAPISVTFLNALKLDRAVFIATISVFFAIMSLTQIPVLASLGLLTTERLLASAAALVPLLGGMPIGAWLAKRIPRETFDKVILALLALIALRLIWTAIA